MACVIGDGEAETGPLATSWHSNKFLNPVNDGAVLPDPPPERLEDRQPHGPGPHRRRRADRLLEGYGHRPYFVEGDEPEAMHEAMAATLDAALDEIADIQAEARNGGGRRRAGRGR